VKNYPQRPIKDTGGGVAGAERGGHEIIRVIAALYTDKRENKIFLIYKEIQSGAVAKSYMRKNFLVYEEMRKYFPIYKEAVSHI
jgi:hypothetical protein